MADTTPLLQPQAEIGLSADGFLTDCWYLAAPSAELKAGTHFRRMILGEPVMLGRTREGEAFALRDICPHRLVPLSAGRQMDTDGVPTVQCPYHGWRFGADGVCRLIPNLTGDEPYDPAKIRVRRYRLHETNGLCFIYMPHDPRTDAEPAVPPPDFGDLPDAPRFTVDRIFNAHVDYCVDGLIDPAHVALVHSQWWWRPPSAGHRYKEKRFVPIERGWEIPPHTPSSNVAYKTLFSGAVRSQIVFQLPGYRWEAVESEKARVLTLTCPTPETAETTRMTQVTWWSGTPLLTLLSPILKQAARVFLNQDGGIIDKQIEGMRYHKAMLWIDDIDTQSKWYRKAKKEWAASRSEGRAFVNPVEPTRLKWRS